jgi:uncharacterized protein (DUF305 family)
MDTSMNHKQHYGRLIAMVVLSFIAMYILMYAMVDVFGNVYPNFNQFYMAGLMTAPMVIIEMSLMGMMYPNKKLNALIIGLAVVLLILFWIFIRQQVAISDKQFLKSMIPHHASALLMCEKASIQDPEIKELCRGIIEGQQSEIDQMNNILNRLK